MDILELAPPALHSPLICIVSLQWTHMASSLKPQHSMCVLSLQTEKHQLDGLQSNPVIISMNLNSKKRKKKQHRKDNHYVLKPNKFSVGHKETQGQLLQRMNVVASLL